LEREVYRASLSAKSIKTAPSGAFFIFGKSIKFILMLLKKIKK